MNIQIQAAFDHALLANAVDVARVEAQNPR